MTLDEIISRLTELREIVGGDAPFCVEAERVQSGRVNVFHLAHVEVYAAIPVDLDDESHWVSLMNGNTTQIVAVC